MKSIILVLTLLIASNANAIQLPRVGNNNCATSSIPPYHKSHSFCGIGQKAEYVKICDNNCNCSWATQCKAAPAQVMNNNNYKNRINRYYNGY